MAKKSTDTDTIKVENEFGEEAEVSITFLYEYDEGVRYYPDGSGMPPSSEQELINESTIHK